MHREREREKERERERKRERERARERERTHGICICHLKPYQGSVVSSFTIFPSAEADAHARAGTVPSVLSLSRGWRSGCSTRNDFVVTNPYLSQLLLAGVGVSSIPLVQPPQAATSHLSTLSPLVRRGSSKKQATSVQTHQCLLHKTRPHDSWASIFSLTQKLRKPQTPSSALASGHWIHVQLFMGRL